MKWMVILIALIALPLSAGDQKPKQFTQGELAEYEAQRKTKAQAALANRLQEQRQQILADASLAQQLSDQEDGQLHRQVSTAAQDADAKRVVAKKSADQELEDACEILFKLKLNGDQECPLTGLPKNLQNLVFDNLQELHYVQSIYDYVTCITSYLDTQNNWNIISGCFVYGEDGGITHEAPIKIWNGKTGKHLLSFDERSYNTTCLAACRDARNKFVLASGHLDGTIRLWNGKTGKLLTILESHVDRLGDTGKISNIAMHVNKNGNVRIVSVEFDAIICVWEWDGEKSAVVKRFSAHCGKIKNIAIHAKEDGDWQIVAGGTYFEFPSEPHIASVIRIWDGASYKRLATIRVKDWVLMTCMASFTDEYDNLHVVVGCNDKTISIWSDKTGLQSIKCSAEIHSIGIMGNKKRDWHIIADIGNDIVILNNITGEPHSWGKIYTGGSTLGIVTHTDTAGNFYISSVESNTINFLMLRRPGQFERALIDQSDRPAEQPKDESNETMPCDIL